MHEPDHPETYLNGDNHSCGIPAQHIISESKKVAGTLIVMATHGRVGVGRWVMGSVTDKVLHSVKTPLLIIHTEHKDAILDGSMDHIIVPLDGSERAELILPHALALAKGLDGKLWLVRVTPGDNMTQSERDELDMLAHQIQDEGVPMLRARCFTETFPGPL